MRPALSKALAGCLALLTVASAERLWRERQHQQWGLLERRRRAPRGASSTSTRASRCRAHPPPTRPRSRTGSGSRSRRRTAGPARSPCGTPRSTTPPGRPDGTRARRLAPTERPRGRRRPTGRVLHRRVRRRRERGLDADPERGRDRPGEPREHVRRADDEPARERVGRARAVRPERDPARICGSCRSTPSRPRPICSTMRQAGCTKAALASDNEAYGTALAKLIDLQKADYGADIVSDTPVKPSPPSLRSYAHGTEGAPRGLRHPGRESRPRPRSR